MTEWESRVQDVLERLNDEPSVCIALDTETTGLKVGNGQSHAIGVSIAGMFENGMAFAEYLPFKHETVDQQPNFAQETLDMLGWVLLQPERVLAFANVQFDILSMDTLGIRLDETNFYDVIVMAHLINENQPFNKGLDSLAKMYLGAEKVVDPFVEQEKKSGNRMITPELMEEYARVDAELTWRLWDLLMQNPEFVSLPPDIWPLKQEMARTLIEMQRRGVGIDTQLSTEMIERGELEMKRLGAELGYPGVPKKPTKMYPNPDLDPLPVIGPIAMEELFITKLNLPVLKRSKKTDKPSFDKEVMEEYDLMLERLESPMAKLVKSYRGWQKAVSAAYRPYVELLDDDGRLRCSYKMHGTKTGRLSCAAPNLQQIPKVTDKAWNGRVKECFVPREGYTLINADFSQLELRLATAYAGEPELKKVFEEGRDIFTEMSEQLEMARHDTKTLVYSMQYGAGLNRLMSAFGVTKGRAQEIRSNYFRKYPLFRILTDRVAAVAESTMRARLWSGRYRHLEFKSEAFKALNSVIQGGAADIVERCMIHCFRTLDNEDCRMLLQVHDSITWEVRTSLVEQYMPRIKATMEDVSTYVGHDDFDVVFAVDVDYWSDREKARHEEWRATA